MNNLHNIRLSFLSDNFKLAVVAWHYHAAVNPNEERRLKIIKDEDRLWYPFTRNAIDGNIVWNALPFTLNEFANSHWLTKARNYEHSINEFHIGMLILE